MYLFVLGLFVSGPLDRLRRDAFSSRLNALAVSTQNNIRTHLRTFLLFTLFFGLGSFPVDEEVLILYIQFLDRNFKSVSSIKNYVFGLQTWSNLAGLPFPDVSVPHFRLEFKGLARHLAHTPLRAHPLSPVILENILSLLDLTIPYHATMWAIMVLGFLLFSRIGNLLPVSSKKFEKAKLLSRSDVFIASDAIVVELVWTKTIQLSERTLQIPLSSSDSSYICPKRAVLNLVNRSPGLPTDLLFTYLSPSGLQIITQSEFTQFLRSCLRILGYDHTLFSGHSLRRGGATHAFSKGVPGELVKSHGDWKSDSYLVYLQFSMSDKMSTTRLMLS